MFYQNKLTGEFGITHHDVQILTNASAPPDAPQIGPYTPYEFTIPPVYDRLTHSISEVQPVDDKQVWLLTPYSAEVVASNVEAKRVAAVPKEVTMRQARLALLGAGMLPGVAAAIAALPSPQKEAAQIEWEYSQTVERNRGFVLLLGAALGLTERQLDDMFTAAAAL